jgi:hypothetical protein
VDRQPLQPYGETLAAEARRELRRLGLAGFTVRHVPGRGVLRLAWPHRGRACAEEAIDFPATGHGVERLRRLLRAYAQWRGLWPPTDDQASDP